MSTKKSAEKTETPNPVTVVVAETAEGKFTRYLTEEAAIAAGNKKSRVHASAESVEKALGGDVTRLQKLYASLTGKTITMKDSKLGSKLVWDALSKLPVEGQEVKRSANGVKTAKKAAERKTENVVITVQALPQETLTKVLETLPPQARACYNILKADGRPQIPVEAAKDLIAKGADQLRTKQDPWRIMQYYRAQLISQGLIREVRVEPAPVPAAAAQSEAKPAA